MFICLVLSFFMVPSINNIAKAESVVIENEKHSLIGSNFANQTEDEFNKYNISQEYISSFTPFNLESGVRLAGNSFKFPVGDRNQIQNSFVKVNETLIEEDDYSLFVWIYFDSVYLHNLTVTLELENGSTIKWLINSDELVNLVKKTTTVNILSLPFSWNKIEFPFSLATIDGEIYNLGKLYKINKLYVDFSSEPIADEGEEDSEIDKLDIKYSNLYFYDIYISNSSQGEEYKVEKQNFRFYKFNFYTNDFIKSLCVGDQITLPLFSQAISYAWNGQVDYKKIESSLVSWSVLVKTPDKKNNFLRMNFGEKINLDKEGVYEIYYQCKDLNISNDAPIFSDGIKIDVRDLRGVYFDKNKYNLEVGKTYILKFHTSSVFSEITEINFTSDSPNLVVTNLGNGTVSVVTNKTGNFTISAKVKGKRLVSNVEKEYTENLKVNVYNKEQENKILKILLYLGLFCGIITIIIVLIKKVVENRKFKVK